MVLNSFARVYWPFAYLLRETSVQILCPFFPLGCLLLLSYKSSFYRHESYRIRDLEMCSPICGLSFRFLDGVL